ANHSWGSVIGWDDQGNNTGNTGLFGSYNGTARDWDTLVRDTGLIVCKSSGNDRNDCNPANANDCDGMLGADGQRYDTIGTQGNSKNIITVGAVNDNGTTIAGFSSSGPADDGRIKPDVVANGVGLTSTWGLDMTLGGCPGANYCSISGTSMSTPVVSGICALLVERYRQVYSAANPSPDIIKALLVNSATDLGRPGPDYLFGHGLVNALAAVQIIDAGPVRIITGTVDQGDVDEYLIALPGGMPSLRVTLNWIDPAGTANSGNNDIVNNLDVTVIGPDNVTRFPFTGPGTVNVTQNATATGPNNIDTVEHVNIANPQQGFWRVRVRGTAVPSGPQNYALVANASFSLPDQSDIRVNAPLNFDTVCAGEQQLRTLSIFNIGGADLLVSSVTVTAGGADFSVLPNPTQPFIVQPGEHIDMRVRFSPTSPGAKAGIVRIVSNDADQGTLDLTMTGTGGTTIMTTFLPNAGGFGEVCIGDIRDQNLIINNAGNCTLSVDGITSTSSQFIVPVVVNYPIIIHPGDSVAVPIRFQPGSLGPKTGTIVVSTTDGIIANRLIPVSGQVPPGDVRVTGSTDFGDVCAGGPTAEKTISICNVGKCNLLVTSVAFNPACGDFTLINNPFPAVVSHDSCVDVVIRYTPTSCGPKQCRLVVRTDDPETPVINLTVTANTPCGSIDVPPDLAFPPTVISSFGPCRSVLPFPISNTGTCPLWIANITIGGAQAADYSFVGLPSFPIILEQGHIVGEGDLGIAFAPAALGRERHATITVTYIVDPVAGTTANVTREFCGEGVQTGGRVLVMQGNIPLPKVEKIQLQRINANRNKDPLDTHDVIQDAILVTSVPGAPCEVFQYHREYGTVSNPIQLLPGAYQVTVSAIINGKRKSKTVGFDVETCTFNPQIVIKY
ncbi:MAG TPA: choice-of-anchor D domain-containing protein, partial [Verrucomicrobiae bacterium]|nr:choice-of-anchor D domain-containing protein [Verrucomicrobiae bacterium]